MKNYLTKLSILLSLILPMQALAVGELSITSGAILNIGGINLTVEGVPIDEIVVNSAATNFNVTLSNSSTFTVTSADKKTMTVTRIGVNDVSQSLACNSNNSVYTISNPNPAPTTITVTITPNADTCTASSGNSSGGGGGGAGGGGGSAGAPGPASVAPASLVSPEAQKLALIESLVKQLQVLQAALKHGGTVSSSGSGSMMAPLIPTASLLKQIFFGERSDNVRLVQKAFASDPDIYAGPVTGFFGPQTRAAIKKFQEKHLGIKNGDLGYGVFGVKTRAKFSEIFGNKSAPKQP